MVRFLKRLFGRNKIIVDGEKYKWFSIQGGNFYVLDSKYKQTIFLCEDHYHDKNGNVVDISLNIDIIKYALENKLNKLEQIRGVKRCL